MASATEQPTAKPPGNAAASAPPETESVSTPPAGPAVETAASAPNVISPIAVMIGVGLLLLAVIGVAAAFRQPATGSIQGGLDRGTGQLSGSEVASGIAAGEPLKVGGVAPDFTLTDLNGEPVTLGDLRGRPVVLNFWATWCPPCRTEMPELQDQHERHPELAIVGVNLRESPEHVGRFVGNAGYTWRIAIDREGKVFQQFAIAALPSTFFIGPDGVIREIRVGGMSRKEIDERVGRLLSGGA